MFYNFNKIDLMEGFAEDIRKINMSGHSKQNSTNKKENNEREASVKTNKANKSSNVNHPAHYGGDTTYEAIKVIEAWSLGFCLGNTVKYISRAGKKDRLRELEDLKKAAWYLNRRIEEIGAK